MATDFSSPVGRLVQGHPMIKNTTDRKGNPLVTKTGPNKGQPTQNFFCAIAVEKFTIAPQGHPQAGQRISNPEWDKFYALLWQEARTSMAEQFDPATGMPRHPRFTFKIMDGDGIDSDGFANKDKPGFAGCWIIKFANGFAPRCFHYGKYEASQQIMDENVIQRGYFLRVHGSAKPNTGSDVPGLYLNFNFVELCGYGEIIVGGPDVAAIAAAAPAMVLPAGASTVPLVGVTPAAPPQAMHQPPQPQLQQQIAPQPQAMQPPAMPPPQAMVAPAPGVVPQAIAPNPALVANALAMQAPPPAGPQYVMTALAKGYTREQYLAQGWDDTMLTSQGMMVLQ